MSNWKGVGQQTDCFAYPREGEKECWCLKDLPCEVEKCNFYKSKNEISRADLERAIRSYSVGK